MKLNILSKGQLEPWISIIIGVISALLVIYVLFNPIEFTPKVQPRAIYSFLESYYKFKIYIGPVLNYMLDKKFFEIFKDKAAMFLQESLNSSEEFDIDSCIWNLRPTTEERKNLENYLNEVYSEVIMRNTRCKGGLYYKCSGYLVDFSDCNFYYDVFKCKVNVSFHIKTKEGINIYKIEFYHKMTSKDTIQFYIERKYRADMLSICNFLKLVHDYIVNNLTRDVCNIYYGLCHSNNLTNKTFRLDKDLFIIEGKVEEWDINRTYAKYNLNISSTGIVYIKLFKKLRLENIIYEDKNVTIKTNNTTEASNVTIITIQTL